MTPTRRSVAMAPIVAITTAALLLLPVGPLASADQPRPSDRAAAAVLVAPAAPPASGAPTLDVTTYLDEVDIPWDVAFVGDLMLVTERDQERILARFPGGETRVLSSAPAGMWHQGETGLMGIAVDPAFAENRRIYTCHGYSSGGTTDIRVVRWGINEAFTAATQQANVITGIQIVTGRHGGCRLRFAGNGALFVGTGDSAVGVNPQSLTSPNGKTLRVIAGTGAPWPGNPFFDAANQVKRTIYAYGHRNVQGLALRKGNQMWSAEHGPDRDDEVNKLKAGSNYGWNPVPGYDESVPMIALAVAEPAGMSPTARKRLVTHAVKEVSTYLGNTPAVCRKSYIDPRVLERFEAGETIERAVPLLGAGTEEGQLASMGGAERAVLRLLTQ